MAQHGFNTAPENPASCIAARAIIVHDKRMSWRIALGLSVILLLAGCSRKPDEQRIRDAVAAMQADMEDANPRAFMAFVTPDFTGNEGTVDHNGLANLMRAVALRNQKIGVILGPIDVEVQGARATLHVTATLTGSSGGLLPENGAIYSITSGWRREGSDWRCYNANWEQKL